MEECTIRDLFMKHGTPMKKQKNQFIFDPTVSRNMSEAYFLVEGVASLTALNEEGEEMVYLYFNEQRIIGFAEILARKYRYSPSASLFIPPAAFWITAKSDCVYYTMKEPVFSRLLDEDIRFASAVLEAISLNYLEIINKVQHTRNVDKETLFCEWLLSCRVKRNDLSIVPKTFTFTEVAKYLGMHPVTVSRIAGNLRNQGILSRIDGCLVITDEKRLLELVRRGRSRLQEPALPAVPRG